MVEDPKINKWAETSNPEDIVRNLKIKDFSNILDLLDEESDVEMSQKELDDFKKQ